MQNKYHFSGKNKGIQNHYNLQSTITKDKIEHIANRNKIGKAVLEDNQDIKIAEKNVKVPIKLLPINKSK